MSRPPSISSLKPIRWVVTHLHSPLPEDGKTKAPAEEVRVSYSAEHKDSLSFAINTASRYEGIIYADTGDRFYTFIRSYAPSKRPTAQAIEGLVTSLGSADLLGGTSVGETPAPVT